MLALTNQCTVLQSPVVPGVCIEVMLHVLSAIQSRLAEIAEQMQGTSSSPEDAAVLHR